MAYQDSGIGYNMAKQCPYAYSNLYISQFAAEQTRCVRRTFAMMTDAVVFVIGAALRQVGFVGFYWKPPRARPVRHYSSSSSSCVVCSIDHWTQATQHLATSPRHDTHRQMGPNERAGERRNWTNCRRRVTSYDATCRLWNKWFVSPPAGRCGTAI